MLKPRLVGSAAEAAASLSDLYFSIKAGLRVGRHLHEFKDLLDSITIDHPEMTQYIVLDTKGYHRNVVIRDRMMELVVITWLKGQESGVHGHPGECLFKLLKGTMREDLYTRKAIKRNDLEPGFVGYVSNGVGYHNVKNIGDGFAVSIHIYSPSFPVDDEAGEGAGEGTGAGDGAGDGAGVGDGVGAGDWVGAGKRMPSSRLPRGSKAREPNDQDSECK